LAEAALPVTSTWMPSLMPPPFETVILDGPVIEKFDAPALVQLCCPT
jgi:hypothetical protein